MGWIDDFKTRIDQEGQNLGKSIEEFIKNRSTEAVVKIGNEQLGNLSQAQIDAGKKGATVPVISASQVMGNVSSYMPILLGVGLLYLILNSKKSRG